MTYYRLQKTKKWYCSNQCEEHPDKYQSKINEEHKKKLDDILILVNEFKQTNEFLMEQYNDIKKVTDEMKVEIKNLKNENDRQNKEISVMKYQLNTIRQDNLNKTLICFDFEHTQNENAFQLIIEEFPKRNIPVEGIIFCRRKPQRKENTKPQPIIITFINEYSKEKTLIAAKKHLKIISKNKMVHQTTKAQMKILFKQKKLYKNHQLRVSKILRCNHIESLEFVNY